MPIIISYLARLFLELHPESPTTLNLDLDFLLSLDAHNHPRFLTGLVERYEVNWWAGNSPPQDSELLNSLASIYSCLVLHREQLKSRSSATTAAPATATSAIAALARAALAPGETTSATATALTSDANPSFRSSLPQVALHCNRCIMYRNAAMDALHSLKALRLQLHAKETIFENQHLLSMRRASGFNTLFEHVVIKETELPSPSPAIPSASAPISTPQLDQRLLHNQKSANRSPPRPASRKRLTNLQLANILREHAQADHDRLTQHPSLKWTWGTDLHERDVRKLFRAADTGYRLPHTGYDESLPDGELQGRYSDRSSLPNMSGSASYSIVGDPAIVPDLSSQDFPVHFHEFPLCRPRHTCVPSGNLGHGSQETHPPPPASDSSPSPTRAFNALLSSTSDEADGEDDAISVPPIAVAAGNTNTESDIACIASSSGTDRYSPPPQAALRALLTDDMESGNLSLLSTLAN